MATGALDANGIWQYGEDDSETTFSVLLNKLGGSTSTVIGNSKPGSAGHAYLMAAGQATVAITSGYAYGFFGTTTVTLPAGRFTIQPIVTCTINSGAIGAANVNISGTTSFTAICHAHVSTNPATFMYQAVQMTSTTSAG